MTNLRIFISDLNDLYREECSGPDCFTEVTWPTLYRLDVDGEAWLTDRHWLLPESACVVDGDMEIVALPDATAAKTGEWITTLRTAALGPCVDRFAACFAGEFTLAGLHAAAIPEQGRMAALVTESGDRVGILMPLRLPGDLSVPLPVPDEVVRMFQRIHGANCVRRWQAWDLAVHLTSERAS